jgi:hypothetical protein
LIGVTISLACLLLVFFPVRIPRIDSIEAGGVRWVFGAGIALNLLQLFTCKFPGSWHGASPTALYYILLSLAALLSCGLVFIPSSARLMLVLLVLVFCALGAWVIRGVPQPYMDVWMLQTEGIKAFRAGQNPFAAVFTDIYHRPDLYATGALRDGQVHQGFPYPPMVFWIDLPGYLIGGDYRWSNLAAMALTAILIAFARPKSRLGPLAAALFLFTPRALFVLESGWTEPVTALLFSATIFCACRARWLMPVFLGLFLCSKQYLIWAIPPVLLLAGRPIRWRRLACVLLIAFVTGCIVSLPLILWDIKAFIAANFGFADTAAFRTDALSYLALVANNTGYIPSPRIATVIGFSAAALAAGMVIRRGRRTPAGYATAVTFIHLVFFAFYKFAFCNYYYFLIAVLCAAIGAMGFDSPAGRQRGDVWSVVVNGNVGPRENLDLDDSVR